jgi:hypothetical protein
MRMGEWGKGRIGKKNIGDMKITHRGRPLGSSGQALASAQLEQRGQDE